MFTLVYGDTENPSRFALKPGATLVGRAPNCDLVLNGIGVSRFHARFTVTQDQCVVDDVGSRNGTYVNGLPVDATNLQDGDQVVIGNVIATIEVTAEDKLALVDGPSAVHFPHIVDRPVDQAPSGTTTVDAARLMALLSGIARSLVKEQPLANVLEEVVRLTLEVTEAQRAFLILKDEKTGKLVPRVVRMRDGQPVERGSISRTVVKRVMSERVAMLASNAQSDQRFDGVQSIAVHKIGAFMCVPLWNQASTIGALYVDTYISEQFSTADLELLTALSNYAAVAIEQSRLATRLHEETRRRERLGRYHSPAVVARIIDDEGDAAMPFLAQEREVTVLFADIVGFTSIAESLPPQQVAGLLNGCFGRMTDIIFEHEGTLDKFIGDALLAVFGAPLDQPDHAARGVSAARAMRRALEKMNAEASGPPIELRMALNTGVALAGDIGSQSRREYTVLGDVVNTASRMESTIAAPGQIVISRATYDQLGGAVDARSLGSVALRGRKEPIEVYEVVPDAT